MKWTRRNYLVLSMEVVNGESCKLERGLEVLGLYVLFGKIQTDTWGWSSGKSQCWDGASGSFPASVAGTPTHWGLHRPSVLGEDWTRAERHTERSGSRHTQTHILRTPPQLFLPQLSQPHSSVLCQRFAPHSAKCSQQNPRILSIK